MRAGPLIVDARDLPFSIEQTPDVFTPFRKRVEALGRLGRVPLEIPDKFKPFPSLPNNQSFGGYGAEFDSKHLEELIPALLKPLEDTFENKYKHSSSPRDAKSAFPYAGGETTALKRLAFYFKEGNPPPVARYKVRR
jgi:deoxyribodipyrimidine photo-lyase